MKANIFFLFYTIVTKHLCVGGDFYTYEKFTFNPQYSDKSVLQNIHKCFCEPYNKTDLAGKPSIVRFPVSLSYPSLYSTQFQCLVLPKFMPFYTELFINHYFTEMLVWYGHLSI